MSTLTEIDSGDWSAFTGRTLLSLSPSAGDVFRGKRILITGAGGSIGSALSRVVAHFDPAELTLLDQSELGLYELGRQFAADKITAPFRCVIGSVEDATFLEDLFGRRRPEVVFHAAGCKHVPLLEANAFAAAKTNALGSQLVANISRTNAAEQCILLSTDKAVEAASIMGATKRIAECIFLTPEGQTTMKIVRLGNVLGSSGSVVPVFREQIAKGEPVTVTHPEATRFFLTLGEAVASLVQSASPCLPSGLLIPGIANPHRIADLARFLIKSNSRNSKGTAISFSGLRPGDKLAERMTSVDEVIDNAPPESILRTVRCTIPMQAEVDRCLKDVREAVTLRHLGALLSAIRILVPEYLPSHVFEEQLDTSSEEKRA